MEVLLHMVMISLRCVCVHVEKKLYQISSYSFRFARNDLPQLGKKKPDSVVISARL